MLGCALSIGHALIDLSSMGEALTGVRVKAEGTGVTGKTIVTCAILWADSTRGVDAGDYALLAFAFGQLAYSVLVFVTYYAHFRAFYLWPRRSVDGELCVVFG